jgi:hypothetical protein
MKTRISVLALTALVALPLGLFQGCYTQFGPATRADEPDEYVTSDSLNYDEYTDARRQFYMDMNYPYSGGYTGASPWYDGWAMYGPYFNGFYPGYGRSTFAYYDPFSSYGYGYGSGYGYSPWYSSVGFAGWAGYGGYYGWGGGHHSVPMGYGGSGRGTTRTIGSRRTTTTSETFVGGTRGALSQPTPGASPAPSTMSLPSGMRRASTPSSIPPAAPRILPTNTGRRGYDGERTPPVVSTPSPSSGSSGNGGRGGERHAPVSSPAPPPSAPAPATAPAGNRGGESRGGDGGSRGGNRR